MPPPITRRGLKTRVHRGRYKERYFMPELPDVEIFRQYIDLNALHQTIEDVEVLNGSIIKGVSPEKTRRYAQKEFLRRIAQAWETSIYPPQGKRLACDAFRNDRIS